MSRTTTPSTLALDGRTALVTGATRGLGLAIARKLCACGCDVVLNYGSSEADAERALESLAGLKGTATAIRADLRDQQAMPELLKTVRQQFGRLDVLVHNAATFSPMAGQSVDLGVLHQDLAISLEPLLSAAALLPELMGRQGRVVAVSSTGAHRVVPGYVSLGVAKAALESLVRYLAVELAEHGIVVNAVSTAKLDKGPGTVNARAAAVLAERTPGGRLTVPADVADVVALLCADEAAWLRGQVVTADGGLSLRA
ncbi:SDR family oxidoreductase [Kitasatospora sp. NBC_01250]|uniref:SDR family oxidoreductase n=1 Tax=Kitasatospora sp. NBC_01250 TaxID=2903571 RepID=UPI002E306641|nr:SDR family oxidoreductase [Kitasatospora sp. NBC_01250]